MASSEWHWEQGIKYALEGIKTALLLNGAAVIALMTFANAHPLSGGGIIALLFFVFGAGFSAIAFMFSYRTQLGYGNAELPDRDRNQTWREAQRWNLLSIIMVAVSVAMFFIGAASAALTTLPGC